MGSLRQTVAQIASVSRLTLLIVFWAGALGIVFLLTIRPPDVELGRGPDDWARALGSPHKAVRQAAAEKLLAAGAASTEALVRVAELRGHADRSERCVDVLRQLYQSPQPTVYQAADAALERLGDCQNLRVRGYVSTTASRSAGLRLSRCAIAFEECGGEMQVDPRQFEISTASETPAEAFTAVIGLNWHGGDEGLVHLRRMPHLRVVHVFEAAPVSREAVVQLRRDRPDLVVIYRNEGCLGVAGVFRAKYFEILTIEPESGAVRAGLRLHDRIVQFAGQEVTSFEMIAALLLKYSPGELLPMVIDRGGERLAVNVPVGRLRGHNCVCADQAPGEATSRTAAPASRPGL
jgi:hypothetical protein